MSLDKLVGQSKLKSRIAASLLNMSGHAFLFTGAKNIGKHTFAKELAKGILCSSPTSKGGCDNCDSCRYFNAGTHPDFVELGFIDSKNIKVDEIRESIIEDEIIAPHVSKHKVYLVNADLLNIEGQNALLKSVEEPPQNVVFIFTVTDKIQLLPTVISRCEELKVDLYSEEEIVRALKSSSDGTDKMSEERISFFSVFAAGVIGNAFDLLNDVEFDNLRVNTMNLMMELPKSSYTKILYDDYHFFEENKEKIDEVLLLMLWFLGDVALLLKNTDSTVKNADKKNELLEFIKLNSGLTLSKIGNCADRINEFMRNAAVNANFECAVGNLLIKMNKELR